MARADTTTEAAGAAKPAETVLVYDIQIANGAGTLVYTIRKGELLVELEATGVYT